MSVDQIKEEFHQWDASSSNLHMNKSGGNVKWEENAVEESAQTPLAEFDDELALGDHLPDNSATIKDVVPEANRGGGGGKQKGGRWERQKWLQNRVPYTYTELIAMAINSQSDQRATLAEIYEFLRINFDCFRGAYTGWKNCIRHTLTLAKSFHKVPRAERAGRVGLGNYWALSDYFHRRSLAGGLGRRSQKTGVRKAFHNIEEQKKQNLHSNDVEKALAANVKSVDEHKHNATPNHWEQQQSNDVEELLRRIGIPPKAAPCGKEQQMDGDKDNAQHRLRQQPTLSPAAVPFEATQNRANRIGAGTKLDLLLTKMGHLRNAKCHATASTLRAASTSSSSHFPSYAPFHNVHDKQQLLPSRHASIADLDHLLAQSVPPFASTISSLASALIQKDDSSPSNVQQLQKQPATNGTDEEEVITVDEDESLGVEEQQRQQQQQQQLQRQQQRQDFGGGQALSRQNQNCQDGPSVASVAQVSAWLGLVAGELRLRLQCDGKNGSMVLSSNHQARGAIHRLQFVPVDDRELVIRQFVGDKLYQEKRWTWHECQEEQTLHAIRGICFHFFFCR
uniref:Fork-head domain-containing protein n=1 Tax=Globodera pallida TaxID=36090 RepID=A0A183BUG6_GLOPA